MTNTAMNEVNAGSANASPAKTVKWTDEQVATLEATYVAQDLATVEALMNELGKTKRQVIGKLVSMGIYVKPEAPVKVAKDEGPSKKEILNDIEANGFDVTGLAGATKDALTRVLNLVGG